LGPGFHLHVAGPNTHRRDEVPPEVATFHGWLQPEALRDLHARCHVFVSPVRAEAPGPPGSGTGVVDGFPTQAAADAMSSGCLLLSANPSQDHRRLIAGQHYVECGPDGADVRDAVRAVAGDLGAARALARAGAEQVRRTMDVRLGVEHKLRHMAPDAGLRLWSRRIRTPAG
ncbi:MAG: glycosyltransferase family protein, partial [Nocardioidaceae bacterium]